MNEIQSHQYQFFLEQDVENGKFDLVFHFKNRSVLYAHRDVLKTCSPVFDAMMQNRWKEGRDGIVDVPFEYDEFKNFINFVYIGQCSVTMEDFEGVISIAQYYQVEALKVYAQKKLVSNSEVGWKEALRIVEISREIKCEELKSKCYRLIMTGMKEILGDTVPLKLGNRIAVEILKEVHLLHPPQTLFQFGFDWACKKVMDKSTRGNYEKEQLVAIFKGEFDQISGYIPLHELDRTYLKSACKNAPFLR